MTELQKAQVRAQVRAALDAYKAGTLAGWQAYRLCIAIQFPQVTVPQVTA